MHGSLYTDPAVFADEMKRIFTDGWVFVDHESEIPDGGDWVARRLGTERVLMARTHDGEISVVANRCAHRGTTLCPESEGNGRNFRCPYHAWTYDLDGTLLAFVFPNLFLGEMNIARIDPLAPGLTEHFHTPLLVESSDPGINRRVILQSEAAMGPGGARSPSSSTTRRCSQTSPGMKSGLSWSPTTFITGCRSGPVTTSRAPG
ncbi:aromatic ring-hydroxylating oxygenase subunit alpha [Candidatus Poriferisodalis sp.]|uniref:aromatic ring-hydroxylating oxygenase subunit alpha n=1 Tax=Candidatus Poriferisodalis sp. TaxID=3101277 RepID=UPI003B58D8FE